MIWLTSLSIWLLFAFGNIPLANWHAALTRRSYSTGKKAILHGAWAAAYIGASFIPIFFHWYTSQWICAALGLSLALLHASVFPVAYNRYMDFPAFNLSRTSKSFFDRAQVSVGFKSSEVVNISCFLFSIAALLFFILKSIAL